MTSTLSFKTINKCKIMSTSNAPFASAWGKISTFWLVLKKMLKCKKLNENLILIFTNQTKRTSKWLVQHFQALALYTPLVNYYFLTANFKTLKIRLKSHPLIDCQNLIMAFGILTIMIDILQLVIESSCRQHNRKMKK